MEEVRKLAGQGTGHDGVRHPAYAFPYTVTAEPLTGLM